MKRFITFCSVVLFINSLLIKAAVYIDTSIVSGTKYKLLTTIPNDYNASKKYSLVVALQPCAWEVQSYRDGLKPITDSLKMIVVCPGLNQTSVPNWNIITASIDSAKSMYNIDTTSVYLTGMSCNGDYALQNGLKKLYPFKGIFPWAPFQSKADPKIIDFNSDMPITLAIGTFDQYNYDAVLNIYDSLKTHGAKINLILVPGIEHTYDFTGFGNVMIHSILYLNDTNSISIKYSGASLSMFDMMDTDPAKEIEFKVYNKGDKELLISSLSSYANILDNPNITYTPSDSTVKLKFMPQAGKAGQVLIILEAREKGGMAVEQVTFKVKVNVKKLPSSVSEANLKGEFSIYPNPTKDKLYIHTDVPNLTIQIIDITGHTVLSKTNLNSTMPLDISMLKKGLYFINVTGKINYATEKLIVK